MCQFVVSCVHVYVSAFQTKDAPGSECVCTYADAALSLVSRALGTRRLRRYMSAVPSSWRLGWITRHGLLRSRASLRHLHVCVVPPWNARQYLHTQERVGRGGRT